MNSIALKHNEDYLFRHETTDAVEVGIHLHDSYEIFQACSDNIRYFVEGTLYSLDKGDIIITNTKELHHPRLVNKSTYGRRYIQFKPYAFTPFFNDNYDPFEIFDNRRLGTKNHLSINKKKAPHITLIIDRIEAINQKNSPSNQLLQKALLVELFIQLEQAFRLHSHAVHHSHLIDSRVQMTLEYINEHFHEESLALTTIAEAIFVDKYYLSHIFKKNTGFTIFEYIQSKRIQFAKKLIHKNMPINEVSQLCGYKDYSNFYKTYKKITGMSPSLSRHQGLS